MVGLSPLLTFTRLMEAVLARRQRPPFCEVAAFHFIIAAVRSPEILV